MQPMAKPMKDSKTTAGAGGLKQRALAEFKEFWAIALYLWVFLGTFTLYRRLILAEADVSYLHYGIALVEALVIAKVILIGRLFGFSRRFDDQPLIVPVLFKSSLFAVLVLLFGFVEHLVDGWLHGQGWAGGLATIRALGFDELAARTLMIVFALVPLVAFGELSRVLGPDRLAALFFARRGAAGEGAR